MSEVYMTTLSNQPVVRNSLHTKLRNMTDEELCHFAETSEGWELVGGIRWLSLELARRLRDALDECNGDLEYYKERADRWEKEVEELEGIVSSLSDELDTYKGAEDD